MVTMFGRQRTEGGLDARIAELSARRARVEGAPPPAAQPTPPAQNNAPQLPERPQVAAPVVTLEPEASMEERLIVAREELSARLGAEIRPERRALLSRGDLAKIVDAAVQAYFVRHSMDANPLARRDLVTDVMQSLLTPGGADANRRNPHKAAIEAAKAQIQPLVLEQMDVAAAAEMPRTAFEAQLTGWVKELLAETKIQLNFTEQRELVEALVADMLGLGPLEPLLSDETVSDIMVNGPKQVYVERRGKLELTDVTFRDEAHLMNICVKIVTRIGRNR
jgi:pilus assembly protein CpaF